MMKSQKLSITSTHPEMRYFLQGQVRRGKRALGFTSKERAANWQTLSIVISMRKKISDI